MASVLALSSAACSSAKDEEPATGNKLPAPSTWDCNAPKTPERVTKIAPSCATDRSCTQKLVSGHRGVGGELGVLAPENTLSAVRAAIAVGADFIETDPRPTKDGVLVNLHDPDVDRTTDGSGDVADMTLVEAQALKIDPRSLAGDYSCERIPTFTEVLTEARGRVHVLVDANKTDRVDLLVQAVLDTGTLEWAIFDTDDVGKIQQALTLEPKLHTMIRVSDETQLDQELQTFVAHPPVIVELNGSANLSAMVPAVHAAGHRALGDVFGTDVAAKFENDPALYGPIFETGLDIAQSDRPELVLEHLGR